MKSLDEIRRRVLAGLKQESEVEAEPLETVKAELESMGVDVASSIKFAKDLSARYGSGANQHQSQRVRQNGTTPAIDLMNGHIAANSEGGDHSQIRLANGHGKTIRSASQSFEGGSAPPPPKPVARRWLTASAASVLLIVALVIVGWMQLDVYLDQPGPNDRTLKAVVPKGSGVGEIASLLKSRGVIDQPLTFRLAVQVLENSRSLQAGEYAFPARITPREVLSKLERGDTFARRFAVAEGLTVDQVYDRLSDAEGLTGPLPEPPPEGSLLPETYFYAYGDSRKDMVKRMQRAMARTLDELWAERAPDLPLASKQEALILASIVEKETADADERRQVAGVFINRLHASMRLQSDPTVIYGLTGGDGALDRALTRKDWQHDSAYNTYQIDGLPPGPIGNPGRDAIAAVLKPANVKYRYFVADGTGRHAFARTLSEHNQNVSNRARIGRKLAERLVFPSPSKPLLR